MEKAMKKAEKERIHLYEWAILERSWWDTVDFISGTLVGWHMRMYPDLILPFTRKWMDSGNIWLQRSSLLFQLKYKKDTDTDLLSSYIQELKDSKEFFIRKAIGWILREYSKTNPSWVEKFINNNPDLSGLSKREGMKVINKNRS
jgi:3-methyladenine DNA glycosylase AlkD